MVRNYGSGKSRVNKQYYGFDESKFLPKQREAAIALVEYEFSDIKKRKTKQEICDEIGISRMTLHNWDKQDQNFIAYKNYLAADFFDSYLPFVYRKMIDGISNGSMKGIELFLKRYGDLDNRSEVTINDGGGSDMSHDERKEELLKRLAQSEGLSPEGPKTESDDGKKTKDS